MTNCQVHKNNREIGGIQALSVHINRASQTRLPWTLRQLQERSNTSTKLTGIFLFHYSDIRTRLLFQSPAECLC